MLKKSRYRYDFVIRSRFDLVLWDFPDLFALDQHAMHTFRISDPAAPASYGSPEDNFVISSSIIHDVISSGFIKMGNVCSQMSKFIPHYSAERFLWGTLLLYQSQKGLKRPSELQRAVSKMVRECPECDYKIARTWQVERWFVNACTESKQAEGTGCRIQIQQGW